MADRTAPRTTPTEARVYVASVRLDPTDDESIVATVGTTADAARDALADALEALGYDTDEATLEAEDAVVVNLPICTPA